MCNILIYNLILAIVTILVLKNYTQLEDNIILLISVVVIICNMIINNMDKEKFENIQPIEQFNACKPIQNIQPIEQFNACKPIQNIQPIEEFNACKPIKNNFELFSPKLTIDQIKSNEILNELYNDLMEMSKELDEIREILRNALKTGNPPPGPKLKELKNNTNLAISKYNKAYDAYRIHKNTLFNPDYYDAVWNIKSSLNNRYLDDTMPEQNVRFRLAKTLDIDDKNTWDNEMMQIGEIIVNNKLNERLEAYSLAAKAIRMHFGNPRKAFAKDAKIITLIGNYYLDSFKDMGKAAKKGFKELGRLIKNSR